MSIMVIAAHPHLDKSRANQALVHELQHHADIYVRDLYQDYPGGDIDVEREQQLLTQYDRVVFQFPFYWYSCPPLLKKWFDDVLTYGWAHGPEGKALKDKEFILATTTGGTEQSYQSGGDNGFTISELLRPIQRTLTRCNGIYLPAFVAFHVTPGTDAYLAAEAKRYAEHIQSSARALMH
ncbi:General stress protein 14 [Paenibacillus plantiphilus]|uniref:General stress protein 14 n=1 Tax=Paenibacillus plantiphilus TaxID=2905650 RepID=A0ABN8G6Q3_9BACL|nr:NAD(P)H-dependent oxidoreductase [Paenibacillus plantiphilus]CAH1201743.1 General stress protein 14 [Paenibacillus plantiphilus]